MSDPVTNVEIEDVLSSIRRLVSENGRAPAAPKPSAVKDALSPKPVQPSPIPEEPKAQETPVNAGRLVLTESLRVSDLPESIEAEDIDLEAAPAHAFSEPPDIDELDQKLPSFLRQPEDQIEDAVEAEELTAPSAEPHPIPFDDLAVQSAEAPVSFDAAPMDADTLEFRHTDQEVAEDEIDAAPRPWENGDERLSEWHSVRTDAPKDYEPDEPGDSDYAGTQVASLEWEDHSADQSEDAPRTEELHAASFEDVSPSELDDSYIEAEADPVETEEEQVQEAVLDEEMLRDLVGEIVRQELQGPLGERITRNVRKLVRREINRAMAARSLNDL